MPFRQESVFLHAIRLARQLLQAGKRLLQAGGKQPQEGKRPLQAGGKQPQEGKRPLQAGKKQPQAEIRPLQAENDNDTTVETLTQKTARGLF